MPMAALYCRVSPLLQAIEIMQNTFVVQNTLVQQKLFLNEDSTKLVLFTNSIIEFLVH
jgi:hypothetical protein